MEVEGLARFVHRVGRLKRVPRTGWLDRGVPPISTESVADHSFRVALLAWLAADEATSLDRDRVLKLALVHDLAEAIVGDQPPYDPDSLVGIDSVDRAALLNRRHVRSAAQRDAKRLAESAAFADLIANLSEGGRCELAALWQELDAGESAEARFVKQADKLETYLQSREYLAGDRTLPMESFSVEVNEVIDVPVLAALRDTFSEVIE